MARKSAPSDLVLTILPDSAQRIPSGPRVNRNRLMPGLRVRHDGWTEERTQRFFDALGHTGCVRDAARVAGVSNAAAYRMKRRFPLFAQAWEDALDRAGQGLLAIAYKRAVEGRETVIIRGGQEYERRITPSDAILGLLLKRGDMAGTGALTRSLFLRKWVRPRRVQTFLASELHYGGRRLSFRERAPMRILHVTRQFPPGIGGLDRVFRHWRSSSKGLPCSRSSEPVRHWRTLWSPRLVRVQSGSDTTKLQRPMRSPPSTDSSSTP